MSMSVLYGVRLCLSIILCYYQAFTTIAVFNALRFCLALLPLSVKSLAEAAVSLTRLRVSFSLSVLLHSYANGYYYY